MEKRYIATVTDELDPSCIFDLYFVDEDGDLYILAEFRFIYQHEVYQYEVIDYTPVDYEDACDACYQMYGRGAGWIYEQ